MYVDINKIYCIDGVYKTPKNIQSQDSIKTPLGSFTVESTQDVVNNQDFLKISTAFDDFYVKHTDSLVSKHQYDFDENLPSNPASSLKEKDYIFIKRKNKLPMIGLSRFNLKDHLFIGKYDYQRVESLTLEVKPHLLKNVLLYGEYTPERPLLSQDVDTYKEDFLKKYSKSVKPTIPMSKALLALMSICIRGHYNLEKESTLYIFLDILTEEIQQDVLKLIETISVNFEYSFGTLKTRSHLLISLFNSFFKLEEVLPYLSDKDSKYLFDLLKKQASFVLPNTRVAQAFKDFLYSFHHLSNFISLTDGKSLFLILPTSSYVELEEGYLLPITNISVPTEALVQLKI